MVREPNVTKYFLIIVNSLLPPPGTQASSLITQILFSMPSFTNPSI